MLFLCPVHTAQLRPPRLRESMSLQEPTGFCRSAVMAERPPLKLTP